MSRDTQSPLRETSFNISNEEAIRRLRVKGQPIRLFGESDKERRLRLRALELIEEKGHDRQAGQAANVESNRCASVALPAQGFAGSGMVVNAGGDCGGNAASVEVKGTPIERQV